METKLEWSHFTGTIAEFLGMDAAVLKRETSFYDDLGLDSLGLFSLGLTLVRTYRIRLPLAVVPTIRTVGDAFDALVAHQTPS